MPILLCTWPFFSFSVPRSAFFATLVLSMARSFIHVTSILVCLITLAISPAQFAAQTSQNTGYYSPPPPYSTTGVCAYPCRPPPIPTTICPPPPPPPYLPQLQPPPPFYPSPGGYVPNIPPFWNYAPPPPNPILPYFPWYYMYPPPPPDYSLAMSPKGIPMAMIPWIIMVSLFTSWF